jgi:two-component sensor histidine kinase
MYDYVGQYKASAQYLRINQKLFARINEQSGIGAMQNKLLASELSFEKSRTEAEVLRARQGKFFISFLVFLVLVISIFSLVLYSQKKASAQQAKKVASINKDLEIQSEQNKLLSLEVHHRTKNNLQMILSLLQMQERTLDNEEARERLQEARARVESIADLHENLLNNHHQFDLNSYISTLINNMVNNTHGDKKVVAHLSIDPISLPKKIELPLALILNEWITNSVKYTQSKTEVLGIYVKLYCEGENIVIHYWDNGLAADSSENAPGFGSQIIPLLVKQIKGQLSTDPHSKYYYILQIPNADRN